MQFQFLSNTDFSLARTDPHDSYIKLVGLQPRKKKKYLKIQKSVRPGSSICFEGFGTATTSALLQILGILRWCRQEDRKPRSQDFKPAPAWIISSGQMESGPGALPGFKCWRAAANSRWEKLPETFAGCNESALQRSDTSCKTSRDECRFTPSYFPFLTS